MVLYLNKIATNYKTATLKIVPQPNPSSWPVWTYDVRQRPDEQARRRESDGPSQPELEREWPKG
jgi:hypothetical protein